VPAVAPHRGANACGISERPVIDEIHAARTPSPVTRPNESVCCVLAKARPRCLGACDHAVLSTEKVVEHLRMTQASDRPVPFSRFVEPKPR
jgi:hypothetical protein